MALCTALSAPTPSHADVHLDGDAAQANADALNLAGYIVGEDCQASQMPRIVNHNMSELRRRGDALGIQPSFDGTAALRRAAAWAVQRDICRRHVERYAERLADFGDPSVLAEGAGLFRTEDVSRLLARLRGHLVFGDDLVDVRPAYRRLVVLAMAVNWHAFNRAVRNLDPLEGVETSSSWVVPLLRDWVERDGAAELSLEDRAILLRLIDAD